LEGCAGLNKLARCVGVQHLPDGPIVFGRYGGGPGADKQQ
jgi:hypothetical protein